RDVPFELCLSQRLCHPKLRDGFNCNTTTTRNAQNPHKSIEKLAAFPMRATNQGVITGHLRLQGYTRASAVCGKASLPARSPTCLTAISTVCIITGYVGIFVESVSWIAWSGFRSPASAESTWAPPTPFEEQTACSQVSMLVYFVKILPHNRRVKRLTDSFLFWTATHEDTKGAGKEPHLYLYAVGKQCLCRCCVQRLQKTIEDQPVCELATQVAHDTSCRAAQRRAENSLKYERVDNICMA
ncbi:hypothetical protein IRJ41_003673, partial [Triplophysa rosa]